MNAAESSDLHLRIFLKLCDYRLDAVRAVNKVIVGYYYNIRRAVFKSVVSVVRLPRAVKSCYGDVFSVSELCGYRRIFVTLPGDDISDAGNSREKALRETLYSGLLMCGYCDIGGHLAAETGVVVKKEGDAGFVRGEIVVLPGFEPGQAEPKTAVLPLHHKTILILSIFRTGKRRKVIK